MTDRLSRRGDVPTSGIVHLGLGAFARAHTAIYVQNAAEMSGGDWGIVGVSLKSPGTRDRLKPQGWTYTAVELAPEATIPRPVEILSDVLVAPEDPAAVLRAIDAASIVSLTVTEKGYCHVPATGRLNLDTADIQQDLDEPERPASAIGFIARGLAARRAAGAAPFTVLSCDNIPSNGQLLRGLVLDLAAQIDTDLRDWIAAEVAFPSTMVDRIVPATSDDDIATVEALLELHDAAPVMHEPFAQWVIEDAFTGERPDLSAAGAQLVADVAPFELMKLRCLNGTHSALAYLGYLAGAETISDTVGRDALAAYVRHLWSAEILPVMTAPEGVDLDAYTQALFDRYANPSIRHRTWQIAMDGSQKLPQRIMGTVTDTLDAGRMPHGLILALAAWMRYTSGTGLDGREIDVRDPLADRLAGCWKSADTNADVVAAYLSIEEVFDLEVAANDDLAEALTAALDRLERDGAEAAALAVTR